VKILVDGKAEGRLLCLDEPISFWGGVDPEDGKIIDENHPQAGVSVSGSILTMAHGRGSSSSASVLAEMVRAGIAPAGLLLGESDPILATGGFVANTLYGSHFVVAVGDPPTDREGIWALSRDGLVRIGGRSTHGERR
jgi:uncharacterized protein